MGPYGKLCQNDFLVTVDEPRKRIILRNDYFNPNIVYVITYAQLREMSEEPRGLFQEIPLRVRLRNAYKYAKMGIGSMLDVRDYRCELAPFAKRQSGIGRLAPELI